MEGSLIPGLFARLGYYFVYFLFRVVVNVFFKDIQVVGTENIPTEGPVVFVGNHNNQFVDSAMLIAKCPRSVGFIIAQSSLDKPFIGHLASAAGAIGVVRPQDIARKGFGTLIEFNKLNDEEYNVIGANTKFLTQVHEGESLAIKFFSQSPRVHSIKSDTEIIVKSSRPPFEKPLERPQSFTIRPHLDHTQLFSNVWNKLRSKQCIGIFPEGGSHDQTVLLPLKAGVSIMALGGKNPTNNQTVTIVPFGLTYFQGHRFRSHVFMEYGKGIAIPSEIQEQWDKGDATSQRDASSNLLKIIEKALRTVTINYPNYETMDLIHTVRRMYATQMKSKMDKDGKILTAEEYLELNRRFALALSNEKIRGDPEVKELFERVREYNKELSRFGLKDYQVTSQHYHPSSKESRQLHKIETISKKNVMKNVRSTFIVFLRCIYILLLTLLSLPGLLINIPIILPASILSVKKAQEAKARSDVKLYGRDVIASHKIIISLILIPTLWLSYMILGFILSGYKFIAGILTGIGVWLLSYTSVKCVEEAIVVWKMGVQSFVVETKNLLLGRKRSVGSLKKERAELQVAVGVCVKKKIGEYYPEWEENRVIRSDDEDDEEGEGESSQDGYLKSLRMRRPARYSASGK